MNLHSPWLKGLSCDAKLCRLQTLCCLYWVLQCPPCPVCSPLLLGTAHLSGASLLAANPSLFCLPIRRPVTTLVSHLGILGDRTGFSSTKILTSQCHFPILIFWKKSSHYNVLQNKRSKNLLSYCWCFTRNRFSSLRSFDVHTFKVY